MNRKLRNLLIGVVGMVASSSALAGTFGLDTLIGSAALGNSGDQTEINGLASLLGVNSSNIVIDSKNDAPYAQSNFDGYTGNDEWYLDLAPATPGYFALKFGTGRFPRGTPDTYYFRNTADLTKLVWSNAQVNNLTGGGSCGRRCNIGRLSHYTTFNDHSVPEPATLGMLGMGMIGLAAIRRRKLGLKS